MADDVTHMAAGVAYYAILSLFPLTIGLMALLSPVLHDENVKGQILDFFQTYLPGSTGALDANIQSVGEYRGQLGMISLAGLFWTASALFGAVSKAVNRAWDVHQDRPFYVAKLRHIAMALSVGVLFLMSVFATSALQFIDTFGPERLRFLEHGVVQALARILPFFFSFGIFIVIYKFVPNTPTYWGYVWPGALFAAFCFELGKTLFLFYLDEFANFERIYGSLGPLVALLVWAYISSFILLIGAELASEYGRMRRGVARGTLAQPRRR